jgi:Flp pilus assembly protein TadG
VSRLTDERHSRRGEQGAAAVEFALIVTVFVALLAGLIQFGYTFYEYIQVAHAAREGVRWAALGEDAQVETRASEAAPGLDPSQMQITIGPGSSSDAVRVTVRYPTTVLIPLPAGVVLPATIESVAEERLE